MELRDGRIGFSGARVEALQMKWCRTTVGLLQSLPAAEQRGGEISTPEFSSSHVVSLKQNIARRCVVKFKLHKTVRAGFKYPGTFACSFAKGMAGSGLVAGGPH